MIKNVECKKPRAIPEPILVTIVYDNNNKLSLSELELIEPELWFRNNRNSAKKLAEEIAKIISS